MLADIARDWTVRDDVKAKLRSSIKRLLVQYDGYCTSAVADALIKDARVLIDALAVRKV